jgi:hypothetical protein
MVDKVEKRISKDERKKLNIIQKYNAEQLQELIKTMQLQQSIIIDETIGEKNYLKLGICSDKHYNDKACDE